jgi:hypothetical protein
VRHPLSYKCLHDQEKIKETIEKKIESSTFDDDFKNYLKGYVKTIKDEDQLNFAIESYKK